MRHTFYFMFFYLCLSGAILGQDQRMLYYFQAGLPQNEGIGLKGTAKIENVEQYTNLVVFIVKLQMTLKNTGMQDLIIMADVPLREWYYCFDSYENALQGKAIQEDYVGPGGNDSTNPIWIEYRKALDQRKPPVDKVRIVKPGESLHFTSEIPVMFRRYQLVKGTPRSMEKKAYWDEIKGISSLFIRVVYSMWDWNLEAEGPPLEKRFGRRVQKKWAETGHLYLDDIVSEPIEIRLPKIEDSKNQ